MNRIIILLYSLKVNVSLGLLVKNRAKGSNGISPTRKPIPEIIKSNLHTA